jgi:hypothetical protein
MKIKYWSHDHVHTTRTIKNIHNGSIYHKLLGKQVIVDGKELPHKYFSDPCDITLRLSTDGFSLFHCHKWTAWPLILFNYNLPPELQFLKEYILCLGIIPGPKKPKDEDSFL